MQDTKYIHYFLIISFLFFVAVLSSTKISTDDDVFWHLATGKYIVQNFNIPSTNIFSNAFSNVRWIPFEWGWDVMNYYIYNLFGFAGISIFRSFLVLSIYIVLIKLLLRLNLNFNLSLILLFFASFRLMGRFTPRPHLMTYLLLILIIYFIVKVKYLKHDCKSFNILPFIFLIWGNIHVNGIIGLIIFGFYIGSEVIEKNRLRENNVSLFLLLKDKHIFYLLKILIICAAGLILNPFFTSTYTFEFSLSKLNLLDHINEWKSPFDSANLSSVYNKIYIGFLFLGIVNLIYGFKKKDYFIVLVFLFSVIYSMQAVRFTFDFIILNIIFLCISLSFFVHKLKIGAIVNRLSTSKNLSIALSVFFVFITYFIYNNYIYKNILQTSFRETGIAINEKFYPIELVNFVSANKINKIGGNAFNSLNCGGFLIWNIEEFKNFIDSRNLSDKQYNEYKYIEDKKAGFQEKMKNYNIDYIIYSTPYLSQNAREMNQTLIAYLIKANEEWKLIFWDDKSFLFVKNNDGFKDVIAKYEYKYINPYNLVFDYSVLTTALFKDKDRLRIELERKLKEEPQGVFVNDLYHRLKL